MPLYMDIHTVDASSFSVEEVVKAHMEDLKVQERFGVNQIKYWVNVEAQTIFCLMTGPNKEACHQVHLEAHGGTPCNIIEVTDDQYDLYLGTGIKDEYDLAHTDSGEIDSGYRSLIRCSVLDLSSIKGGGVGAFNQGVERYDGRLIQDSKHHLSAAFVEVNQAFALALEMKTLLDEKKCNYSISLVTGRPVDPHGENLFESARETLDALDGLCRKQNIQMDKASMLSLQKSSVFDDLSDLALSVFDQRELNFLIALKKSLDQGLNAGSVSVEDLAKDLGSSRSQLYRKTQALCGLSPNKLISQYKLRKSVELLLAGGLNISETAYRVGFNSPAYFTTVFKNHYGQLPTELALG